MNGRDDGSLPRTSRRELLRTGIAAGVGLTLGCGGPMLGELDAGADGGRAGDAGGPPPDGGSDAGAPDAGAPDAGPPPVEPPEIVAESSADFPLGVASGDATDTSAIFWTAYAGAMPLELVVWEMEGDAYARTVHVGPATPVDGYVHVDVATLRAGARYRYAFFLKDGEARIARSPIGRMRAALAPDAMEPLTIGAVSCTSNTRAIGTLAHAAGRNDLDVFVFLGDTTYNDGARTLAEYRAKWIESIGREAYRALRASTSALATWDDHEFDNDWNPETFDPAQRAAAVRAFFEHQPVRRDPSAPDRVYKAMRWGRTAELFVLDCRSERRPSTRSSASPEYISPAQLEWLKSSLLASTAVFKIIVNSVPIGDFPGVFDLARGDRWEGYGAQRTDILRFIDDNAIPGVVWLAGDFHLASAGRVATSGPGSTQLELLAGPGAQTGNLLAAFLNGPQFDFATRENNYTVLELEPRSVRLRAWWHDSTGSVIEVLEYDLG